MFRKILVAYDGSPGADRALATALDLARLTGAELWALAVEERLPHLAATVGEMEEEKEFANRFYGAALARASDQAARAGVPLRTELRPGHPARTIVEFARTGGFDLIVLGHCGHSAVWAMFLGATTEKVSRHAPCSVLIVR